MAGFRRHCGAGHAGPTQAPPGFLHGKDDEAMAAIRQCAPRIAFRLGMRLLVEDQRDRSPMPPPTILSSRVFDETQWRSSIEFSELLHWSEAESKLHTDPSGTSRLPAGSEAMPVTELAACLPASGGLARAAGAH